MLQRNFLLLSLGLTLCAGAQAGWPIPEWLRWPFQGTCAEKLAGAAASRAEEAFTGPVAPDVLVESSLEEVRAAFAVEGLSLKKVEKLFDSPWKDELVDLAAFARWFSSEAFQRFSKQLHQNMVRQTQEAEKGRISEKSAWELTLEQEPLPRNLARSIQKWFRESGFKSGGEPPSRFEVLRRIRAAIGGELTIQSRKELFDSLCSSIQVTYKLVGGSELGSFQPNQIRDLLLQPSALVAIQQVALGFDFQYLHVLPKDSYPEDFMKDAGKPPIEPTQPKSLHGTFLTREDIRSEMKRLATLPGGSSMGSFTKSMGQVMQVAFSGTVHKPPTHREMVQSFRVWITNQASGMFDTLDPDQPEVKTVQGTEVAEAESEPLGETLDESLIQSLRQEPTKEAQGWEGQFEMSLPEIEDLFRRMSATPRVFKRLWADLWKIRKNDYTEATFARELQSIVGVLQQLETVQRGSSISLGKHLKKTSIRGIWEIKPQGRSQLRLVLGLGPGGYRALAFICNSKNNENLTSRKLHWYGEIWDTFLQQLR